MSPKKSEEFLEPLVERVLRVLLLLSPMSHVKKRTHGLVEMYVLSWYLASIVMIALAQVFASYMDPAPAKGFMAVFMFLSAFRIFDCITANVQISLLEVLHSKGREDRLTSRNVLLLGINFLEFLNNFCVIFFCMAAAGWGEFNGVSNVVDALYFSLSTLTTLGFGDIHAVDMAAKLVVIAESLIGIVFLFIVLNVFVSTIQTMRRRGNS